MKRNLFVMTCLVVFAVSCSTADKKEQKEQKETANYEKAKETLEEREKKNPTRFISVTGKDKHNLIGQTVIKGLLKNKATVCSYKDIDVEYSFFSKTGTLLEKDHETIYEKIGPGDEVDFKIKQYAPKGTDSISLRVLAAKTDE